MINANNRNVLLALITGHWSLVISHYEYGFSSNKSATDQ